MSALFKCWLARLAIREAGFLLSAQIWLNYFKIWKQSSTNLAIIRKVLSSVH